MYIRDEETFKRVHSSVRKVAKRVSGIICAKWRQLLKGTELGPDNTDITVKCISLLYNIIIDKEGIPQSTIWKNSSGALSRTTRHQEIREMVEKKKAYDI
jgi:hypothetical protein